MAGGCRWLTAVRCPGVWGAVRTQIEPVESMLAHVLVAWVWYVALTMMSCVCGEEVVGELAKHGALYQSNVCLLASSSPAIAACANAAVVHGCLFAQSCLRGIWISQRCAIEDGSRC